jgi:hypothetical protein
VQVVVKDDPATRTLRVHLLGYNAPPQTTPAKDRPYVLPVPSEDAPIYRVNVTTSMPLRRARALNDSTALKRRRVRKCASTSRNRMARWRCNCRARRV